MSVAQLRETERLPHATRRRQHLLRRVEDLRAAVVRWCHGVRCMSVPGIVGRWMSPGPSLVVLVDGGFAARFSPFQFHLLCVLCGAALIRTSPALGHSHHTIPYHPRCVLPATQMQVRQDQAEWIPVSRAARGVLPQPRHPRQRPQVLAGPRPQHGPKV